MWDNTIITDKGIDLLKRALDGEQINITAIKAGAGKSRCKFIRKPDSGFRYKTNWNNPRHNNRFGWNN